MPAPQSSGKGYTLPGIRGFTMARASGLRSGGVWWSVMMTSAPARMASAISSASLTPQSTVTMRVAPWPTSRSTAVGVIPCPSFTGCGRYGMTFAPSRSRVSVSMAVPVMPSTSKSPNTATVSPAWAAAANRGRAASMPASKLGGCGSPAGSRNCSRARRVPMPRDRSN